MKCPKCQYIGFDSGDRCRNCGYEFSFATEPYEADLPIQTGLEPVGPLADLSLRAVEPPASDVDASAPEPALAGAPAASLGPDLHAAVRSQVRRGATGSELPLFNAERAVALDEPMVAPSATPRPPLAVRRAAAAAPRRGRPVVEEGLLNLEPPPEPDAVEPSAAPTPVALLVGAPGVAPDTPSLRPAGAAQRALAASVDAVLLSGINVAVLYFTLRVCGLDWREIALVPALPFLGYLLLLDGGYSVAFTSAGGQTIGKMAARIKVIPAEPAASGDDRVSIGQSVLRSAAWIASAVAVGLGFLPALFGADRRAMHDWLAATRVVKA